MNPDDLLGAAIGVSLRVLARLPLRAIHALGAAIGLSLYVLPTESRRIARRNIELCFPQLDLRQRRALLRSSLLETGKGLLEASALWLWTADRTVGLVREVEGQAELDNAFAEGRGVVVLGPHLGCWELTGLYCSHHYPMVSLYRPFRIPRVDALMRAARERAGARLLPVDRAAVLGVRRALQRAELVGILPDQDPAQRAGVFTPFFGVEAHTMTLASRLVRQSGAAAVFAFAERLPGGSGFRLHFQRAPGALADPDPARAARALNQGIERCIAISPAQYLWVYRRFKTRPAGEASLYPPSYLRRWRRRRRRQARRR